MIESLQKLRPQILELCLRHHVRQLGLFGSAALGEFDSVSSDIDFLVDFDPLGNGAYADHYFGLLEDLEALFGRHVDLVVLRAIKNPFFLKTSNAPASCYMQLKARKYLFDMKRAIDLVGQFIVDKTFENYINNYCEREPT